MNKLTKYSREHRTNSTPAEMVLWSKLRNRQFLGFKFRRQCPVGDRYIVDFICKEKNLVIEINGSSHDENKFTYDIKRQKYLEEIAKLKVINFTEFEARFKLEEVLDSIERFLTNPSP